MRCTNTASRISIALFALVVLVIGVLWIRSLKTDDFIFMQFGGNGYLLLLSHDQAMSLTVSEEVDPFSEDKFHMETGPVPIGDVRIVHFDRRFLAKIAFPIRGPYGATSFRFPHWFAMLLALPLISPAIYHHHRKRMTEQVEDADAE
jgi:hypothetical protein